MNNNNNRPNLLLCTVVTEFNLPCVITVMTHLPCSLNWLREDKKKNNNIHPHEKTGNVVIRHALYVESDGPILIHQHVRVNSSPRLSGCPSSLIKGTLCAHI